MVKSVSAVPAKAARVDEQQAIERVMRLIAVHGRSCEEGAVVRLITEELLRAGLQLAEGAMAGVLRRPAW